MRLKYKVLINNFFAFAILFVLLRLVLHITLKIDSIYLAVIAAVGASIFAPKFAIVKKGKVEKIVMKWIFIKGFKEM